LDIEEQELINKNERNTIANANVQSEDFYKNYSEILLNKPIKGQVKKRMKKVFE